MASHIGSRREVLDSSIADVPTRIDAQIYSKLAATFGAAATVREPGDRLLSIMLPGLYVNPNLDPLKAETQYTISNLADPLLACSWRVLPGAGVVSDVYKSILDGKETPLPDLAPEERELLEEALSYLFDEDGSGDPSDAYLEYARYREAYLTALAELDAAVETQRNGGPEVPPKLRRQVERAVDEWQSKGHRSDVERSLDVITLYGGRDPARYWSDLAERFRRATRRAGYSSDYQYVTCVPPYPEWFDDFGWFDFSFDDADFLEQDRSGALNPGWCCCCNEPGLAGVDTGSHDTQERARRATGAATTNVVLKAQLRLVGITRPWLDATVFSSRSWRWSEASVSYGTVVSTGGDLAGLTVPTGVMPVLPTGLVMARNVDLYWSDGDVAATFGQAGRRPRRLGPFPLDRALPTEEGHYQMRDPAIVGYVSNVLGRCPDPDPRLPWALVGQTPLTPLVER